MRRALREMIVAAALLGSVAAARADTPRKNAAPAIAPAVPPAVPGIPPNLKGRPLSMISPAIAVQACKAVDAAQMMADVSALVACGTRHALSDTTSSTHGIGAARRYIYRRMQDAARGSGGRMSVAYQPFTVDVPLAKGGAVRPARLVNVVATIRGTDPACKRIYVIGGHYDSRGTDLADSTGAAPGADDDASGVAVVLEACRQLANVHVAATIVCVAFAGEEQGLLGSDYFAKRAKAAGWTIDGMWANDIVGATQNPRGVADSTHIRLFSAEPAASPSRELARYTLRASAGLSKDVAIRLVARPDRFGRGSDHLSFNAQGYAAVRFCEPIEDYRHQHQTPRDEAGEHYGDDLAFVNPAFMASVARMNIGTVVDLAAAAAPVDSAIVRGIVEPDVHVTWWAPADPSRQGFKVLRRATTAANWQEEFWVGERTEITIPGVTVDDNEWAVVAVGQDAESHAVPCRIVR